LNTGTGFVTFRGHREAEIARRLWYTYEPDEWRVSFPPEAPHVDWRGLSEAPKYQLLWNIAGYALVVLLYITFLPICITITNLAFTIHVGTLQPLWEAFAPTLALLLFISFFPTFLLWIFEVFFTHSSRAWAQHKLQTWYFYFQVFFVVLVTAVGSDFSRFIINSARNPTAVFGLLALKLPYASHFYMHYLVLQWTTHSFHALRAVNLVKYLFARQLWKREKSREMAEPEDEAYYGMGSRSARWSTNLTIGIVFSTLSPLVPLLTLIDCCFCRLVHTYLLVFAETKKYDLGGAFWVTKLEHILLAVALYCGLMIGVLGIRAPTYGPLCFGGPSFLYALRSYMRLSAEQVYTVGLPFNYITFSPQDMSQSDTGDVYIQRELMDDIVETLEDVVECGRKDSELMD